MPGVDLGTAVEVGPFAVYRLRRVDKTFPARGVHALDELTRDFMNMKLQRICMSARTLRRAATCWTRWQTLVRLELPAGLPQLFTGLEIASVGVMACAITGEGRGGGKGLGLLAMHLAAETAAAKARSAGKIKTLAQRGECMPEGWMVGADGEPLTDPARQREGFLLPIGGAKGYGLDLAIALRAGSLNGAATGREVIDVSNELATAANTGQLVVSIDLSAFGDAEAIARAATALCADVEASATLPGHKAVRVPGARRGALYAERHEHGLPLNPNLRREPDAIADECRVARPGDGP